MKHCCATIITYRLLVTKIEIGSGLYFFGKYCKYFIYIGKKKQYDYYRKQSLWGSLQMEVNNVNQNIFYYCQKLSAEPRVLCEPLMLKYETHVIKYVTTSIS